MLQETRFYHLTQLLTQLGSEKCVCWGGANNISSTFESGVAWPLGLLSTVKRTVHDSALMSSVDPGNNWPFILSIHKPHANAGGTKNILSGTQYLST